MSMLSTTPRRYIATTVWLLMQQQNWKLARAFTVDNNCHKSALRMMIHNRGSSSIRWMSSSNDDDDDEYDFGNRMQAWSLEDDWFLYRHYQEDSPEYVAKELRRGIRGVEARWFKLNSVSSPVYQRLFAPNQQLGDDENDDNNKDNNRKEKLMPVHEVLQRIQWDPALESKDFTVWYEDRYQTDGKLVTSPFDAPNLSVKGKELLFVKAIPAHRIQAIQYDTDYIIWDKDARVYHDKDLIEVTSDENYAQWKKERLLFQKQLCQHLQQPTCLGTDKFQTLKDSSSQLLHTYKSSTTHHPQVIDDHVQLVLKLFQSIYHPSFQNNDIISEDTDNESFDDDSQLEQIAEVSQFVQPTSDIQALQIYLDLVSFLPHYDLRAKLTRSVQNQIVALQAKEQASKSQNGNKNTNNNNNQSSLPKLKDEDLEEKFVRGSGNGGQKVNKTSNRVILLHIPTQLRVECQDTRSLQQNRKIARKRLQQKLDTLVNGATSKKAKAQQKIRKKKQKSKSKAKKMELAEKQEQNKSIRNDTN